MSDFQIGIRKHVEMKRVQYWLAINAKAIDVDEDAISTKEKFGRKSSFEISLRFIHAFYWKIFILLTILINTLITINNFFFHKIDFEFWIVVIIIHLTCFFFWIDFLAAIGEKIIEKKKGTEAKTRKAFYLILEAISLLPLSTAYLIVEHNPDFIIFWSLRSITLIRFYRIPFYLSKLATAGRNHWKIFMAAYIFYFTIFIDIFANYYLQRVPGEDLYNINGWNETLQNKFIVSIYFSSVTLLNVGFGDIFPSTYFEMMVCAFAMIVGCSIISGVLMGALATEFTNMEKKREIYRHEFELTMKTLKDRKIDKKVIEKISDNWIMLWKYKKGYTGMPPVHILPLSLQKEIYFDVNFGLLNRSPIFAMQPRSFLRSVSLLMRNMSYLPGDIIMEPFGIADAMLCVASGVIEILSEENDETTLFSLTTGSILGEITLFVSIPIRCIIRASTYVELQVLHKVNFSRMALKYPDIFRSMKAEIAFRFTLYEDWEFDESNKALDLDFHELSRRKATKRFLQDVKRHEKEDFKNENGRQNALKASILGLYVLSENIPKVKTLPIYLIKSKPWILRPNTTLTELWDVFIVITVSIAVFVLPYLAGFVRSINTTTYVYLFLTEVIYCVDLYIQCTTAIERKDHFTYITSIRSIIGSKLKTFGFYLDIFATYDLSIYANVIWPKYSDYAYLLLSQNRVLKIWQIPRYFHKLENTISTNLLFVRAIKYVFYLCLTINSAAVMMYLEACPEENCAPTRWFYQLQQNEVSKLDPTPCTEWPDIVSLYWACITVSAVGYGDIVATAVPDCLLVIFWITVGTVLLTICLAQASSTFKHLARVRTNYQEEVFAVDRFMTEHEIPKDLQRKVRNYFQVQWNYDKGFSLKSATIVERLPSQQRQIILTQVMKTLLTVPLFYGASTDFLKLLAKLSRVRVLPPHEVITDVGSFVREMYIVENGYCEVTSEESTSFNEKRIIGPVNPFGYLEMILGIPLKINVQTLTHARIISLDYSAYLRAVTKYPSVKTEIDNIIEKDYGGEIKRKSLETLRFKPLDVSEQDSVNLLKQKKLLSKAIINVYRYQKSLSKNYWEPFRAWGKFRFLQFLVLPFVIVPHSIFIKIWMSLRIIGVIVLGLVAPIHFSLPQHTENLADFIITLQMFAAIDMYLMFHVGYYDQRGLLMFHPAKTAIYYLKGNFAIDLITVFPFYLIIRATFQRPNNSPSLFFDAPGLIMVFQFYKFFQGCYYLENDILRRTEIIKILKFLPLTIIITNLVSGLLILLECYKYHNQFEDYSESVMIAEEFHQSILIFCAPQHKNTTVTKENISLFKMYVTALYWVTSTMTGCGFGDLSAHNKTTMIAVMIIVFLGIFLYGYMFANLTSSMISVYNLVTKYQRRIRLMTRFMRQKNVSHNLQTRLILHYEYNWQRTEGARPQKMFTCVHAALRENIVASMYEATVRQVPAFVNVEKSVIRVIGKHLDEIYFLRGETIVKYNDVLEYIYLIYRGTVDVLSKDGALITTMGGGGIFGNISKTPFSLSSVVVVATKNVDILRLDCAIFFKALQVFPNTKSLIKYLTSRTTDYIEPLAGTTESTFLRRSFQLHLSLTDTIPYEITTSRSVRPSLPFSVIDLAPSNSYFFLKNSVFKHPKKHFYTFVILPDSSLHKTISIIVFLAAFVSAVLTMYMMSFQDFSIAAMTLSYFTDIIFYFQVILQFHSAYFDKFGDYVVNRRKIQQRYFRSKKTIGFDIAANLPLEIFSVAAPSKWVLPILSILRLNRILRLNYIFEFYELKFKVLMINKIYLELSWILVCISLMIHFFACIWFFVACPLGHCSKPTWATEMGLSKNKKWKAYLVSLYYVITLITTTGYGDISIYTTQAMLTSISFMILSRFGIVLLAGAMAAVINVHSINLYLYQEMISELKESFQRQNISEYQMTKMWNYVMSLWLRESGKQVPKFITTAPYSMKCEVMNAMFGSHLSQSYIFSQMDEAFLRQLAIYLNRFVYFPGNYIVQQGDIDHTMYFIHKGQVSVLTIHPNLMETIHFTMVENDHFGMTQGLIIGKAHHFSYRAETEVEILSLTLSNWQHLLKYFPQIKEKIYKRLDSLPVPNLATSFQPAI